MITASKWFEIVLIIFLIHLVLDPPNPVEVDEELSSRLRVPAIELLRIPDEYEEGLEPDT